MRSKKATMSEPVVTRVCTNLKEPKLVGIYHFVALPRAGENIRLTKAKLYSVEQVEWSPFPELPTIFVREW